MEMLSYVVHFTQIICNEAGSKNSVWFKVRTYSDPAHPDTSTVTHHYENSPLRMNAKGDNTFYVDISVPATGVHKITFELWMKNGNDSSPVGSFDINRGDALLGVEQSSVIELDFPDSGAIVFPDLKYTIYWRVASNIIPSLRVIGLYCQRSSAGCDKDRIEKVAAVKGEVYDAASTVIGLWKGPTATMVSDAFLVASKVVDDIADLRVWLHEVVEGDDDIYLQHVDPNQGDNAGGGFCPPNARTMAMNNGVEINFQTHYNQYFRFPLDTGPVTIQVRERDGTGRDVCLGALTIGEAEYTKLESEGAKVEVLTDFLNDRNDGEGAVYHLCYAVANEDWAKAPKVDTNGEQCPY